MMRFEMIATNVPPGTMLPPELRTVCDELDRVGYPISGYMRIRPDDLAAGFGRDNEMASQFAAFGAGGDSSIVAFWLRNGVDAREAPVVHLGSEGDRNMVMARDFREFLRLLAIGYDELGFDDLSRPPSHPESANWLRAMVRERYHLDVPAIGSENVSAAQAANPSVEAAIEDWYKRRYGNAAVR